MIKFISDIYILKLKSPLKQPLIQSMMVVGFIGLLIKITGFYKETMVAANFGLSELMDTFIIASLVPTFVQHMFINALSNLFVPNYITELKTTKQKAGFQSVGFFMVTVIVVCLIVVCLIFSEFFLTITFPNHTEEYYHLIRTQLYWILPCLFFWGYSSLFVSLLEVQGKFKYSSISPVFTVITTIACISFFESELRALTLVIGLLSGGICSFVYLLILCVHYRELQLGKMTYNRNIRNMMSQMPPKIVAGFLSGSNSVIDKFFAAQLVTGSIAALNYANKIPAFTVSMLILPLSSVLLPHFSRTINDDPNKAYKQLFKIMKWVFFCSLGVSLLGVLFSTDIIRLFFERKEFTSNDTFVVSNLQRIGLLYIPFYLCTLICVKFLTAINRNKFMAWVSFWNLGVNLVLNFVFVRFFGVYGLALSTTIMYVISGVVYIGFTYREFKKQFK